MLTSAKRTFDVNIKRASYFLDIHQATQPGVGAPALPRRELPRGAVVFAVGALDAYVSEVSAEVLIAHLQTDSIHSDLRAVLKRLRSEVPTLALEVALISGQDNRINYLRRAILDHFHNDVSNFGATALSQAIQRVGIRTADFWAEIGQESQNAADDLDYWTDIRHRIVHRGEKPRVHRSHAREFIELVRYLAITFDRYASQSIDEAQS